MSSPSSYATTFEAFPSRRDHEDRWADLARAIAADRGRITDDPAGVRPPETAGELTVLGSGIETVGFTSADEALIRGADDVFYCVADPATSVWLKALRPDAYDLYVLYDDSKLRYLTYMQMAEAMLHFVRRGRRVVAIFYGHPGIFVLSTHRAIAIARREGHRAVMRPGISALDTLCADLGVDPSQPGMQTFEATDMLVRRRRPDPGLHVVLWQVGLIGELGYRRQGYLNSGFSVLLDYLEDVYGPDQPVVNYVGSRYPGIDPVIDRQTIASLRAPEEQARVTGISTFYVAPREVVPADRDMLELLGLVKPGQSIRTPAGPLREIDKYGPREMRAFDDFARFRVPAGYHWQEDTAAARFILALREDDGLRGRYARSPVAAVASWPDSGLCERERTMLALRDAGAAQIAAKGVRTKAAPEAGRMLRDLLSRGGPAKSLARAVRRAEPERRRAAAEAWSASHGYATDWEHLRDDLELLMRGALYPWAGLYVAPDRDVSLFLLGRAGAQEQRVWLNGHPLAKPRYARGTLTWSAADGNPTNGNLKTDVTPRGARRLSGYVWPAGEEPASPHRLTALEQMLPPLVLESLAGTYRVTGEGGGVDVVVVGPDPDAGRMRVDVNGQTVTGAVSVGRRGFDVGGLHVPLEARILEPGLPSWLWGEYRVRVVADGCDGRRQRMRLTLGADGLAVDGTPPVPLRRRGAAMAWSGGPAGLSEGEVTPLLDPITLSPLLFGAARAGTGAPSASLVGMVPPDEAWVRALAAAPRFGIPPRAWDHLVGIAAGTAGSGGLFLWQTWEKVARNLRLVRSVLEEVR